MRDMQEMNRWLEEHGIAVEISALHNGEETPIPVRDETTGYLGILPKSCDVQIKCTRNPSKPYIILGVQEFQTPDKKDMFYKPLEYEKDGKTILWHFRTHNGRFAIWPYNQMQLLIRGADNKFDLVQISVTFRSLREENGELHFDKKEPPRAYLRAQVVFSGEVHQGKEGLFVIGDYFIARRSRRTLYGSDHYEEDIIKRLFEGLPQHLIPKTDLTIERERQIHRQLVEEQHNAESIDDTTPGIGTVTWSLHSQNVCQVRMEDGRLVKLHVSNAITEEGKFWAPMHGDTIEVLEITNTETHKKGPYAGQMRLEGLLWTDQDSPS